MSDKGIISDLLKKEFGCSILSNSGNTGSGVLIVYYIISALLKYDVPFGDVSVL